MKADRFAVAYGLDLAASPPVCRRETARGGGTTVPWPPDEATRRELERGTAALVVAAPAGITVVRHLEAPFASARKAARIWASLLDTDLPFPVEAAQCAFIPEPSADGKARALACAVRRADLEVFLDGVSSSGFEPSSCDAEALALWEHHLHEVPPANENRAILLVHAAAGHVAILRGHGRILESVHVLRTPPSALPAAQWRARFRQVAPVSGGDGGPVDVWWSGTGDTPEAIGILRNALSGEAGLRHEIHREPSTFLARALALRAIGGHGICLLPDDRIPAAVLRNRLKRSRMVWAASATLSLLVLALNAAMHSRFHAEESRLKSVISDTASSLMGTSPIPGQEVFQAKHAMEDDAPAWNAVHAIREPDPHTPFALSVLGELAGRGVRFAHASWSPAGLDISGDAPSARAIENLGGWAPSVTIQPSAESGRTAFRMKGEWPDGL